MIQFHVKRDRDPSSPIKVLEMRLRNRKTNSEESIKKRLIEAKNEIKKSNDFNHVIINDNLESAFSELCNIIDSF